MKKSLELYSKWINSPVLTKAERLEMKNMKDDEIESSFMERGLSFGTGGVRAKMGYGTSVLNMYTYAQLADAFANYLVKKYHSNNFKVVIGHDNRKYSDEFTKKVADVLTSFGISIILFPNNELVPTPLVSFAIRTTKAKAGIVITASHNPKEYNGFKIYDENGCQATEEITHKVSQIVNKPIDILKLNHKPNPSLIAYASKNIYDQYFRSCIGTIINKSIINIKKSLPIVFTGHHGTASKLMPLFLNKYLHFNVLPVKEQCKYDLNFTNSPLPNPEDTNSFDNAIKYAEQIGSEICMGTDPDADRVGVCIKHKGEWQTINGNQMGCILAHYILTNKHVQPHSYIATTFVSTNLIKKICKKYCIDLYVTKTGFKWIGKLIDKLGSKHHYLLGFEESVGALPYTNTRDKDSFTSSALILEINFMCKKMNIDLIDYLNKYIYDVFGYCYTSTNTITINGVNWQSKVVKLINKLKQVNINMIGNYKILSKKYRKEYDVLEWKLTNNSWIKFRMSGTEPKIKTYLNLYINNDKDSQSIIDEVMSRLESIMK